VVELRKSSVVIFLKNGGYNSSNYGGGADARGLYIYFLGFR